MLTSGLEVMEHAIEHFEKGTERDMRIAVLHADNAVELILKELVRFEGMRLMNKKGHSLGYYDCIERLQGKGVKIPELPDIDLLHTERNSIYHLGNQPDRRKTEWLVYDVALGFLKRICKDELNCNISKFSKAFVLPDEVKFEVELTRSEIVNKYLKDSIGALNSGLFETSVLLSYVGIEALLRKSVSPRILSERDSMKKLVEERIISKRLYNDFQVLRQTRNNIAHGVKKSSAEEANFALKVFGRINEEIGMPEKRVRPTVQYALVGEKFDLKRFQTNLRALEGVSDSETRCKLIERIRHQTTDLPYDGMPHDIRKAIMDLLFVIKEEIENKKMRRLCLDILHIINGRRDIVVNAKIKELFLSWIEKNYQDLTIEEKHHATDIQQRLSKHDPKLIKELMLNSIYKWSPDEFRKLYKEIEFDHLAESHIDELKSLLWKLRDEASMKQLGEQVQRIDKLLELYPFR